MKKVLLAAITLAITLVAISCGKENDNPVEPPQREEEVVIKKIKEVNISFLVEKQMFTLFHPDSHFLVMKYHINIL
ncbi:hypothetical protein ACI76Y_08795 [Capnocytophaga cynodegmi]|uniref:hypothetical protein n=1 Tax=Capnocytophaga cynodegmi TaxID=28189 RepID=UPI00385D7DE0